MKAILAIWAALLTAAVFLFSVDARAASSSYRQGESRHGEGSPCAAPLGRTLAQLRERGVVFLSLTDVRGIGYDKVLLVSDHGSLIAGVAQFECMVGGPMMLGATVPEIGV